MFAFRGIGKNDKKFFAIIWEVAIQHVTSDRHQSEAEMLWRQEHLRLVVLASIHKGENYNVQETETDAEHDWVQKSFPICHWMRENNNWFGSGQSEWKSWCCFYAFQFIIFPTWNTIAVWTHQWVAARKFQRKFIWCRKVRSIGGKELLYRNENWILRVRRQTNGSIHMKLMWSGFVCAKTCKHTK